MVLEDSHIDRLGRAWLAAGVGMPGLLRERERERLNLSLSSMGDASVLGPLLNQEASTHVNSSITTQESLGQRQRSPWRNPGDHHEKTKQPFEEHTIATAQHAAVMLSRHPYSPARTRPMSQRGVRSHSPIHSLSPRARGSPEQMHSHRGSPAQCRRRRDSPEKSGVLCSSSHKQGVESTVWEGISRDYECLTTDEVVDWLDKIFEHDDEERKRMRHAAIRQAGVDGSFLRELVADEKLCMFELVLTRLQARRLAAAINRPTTTPPSATPSQLTPSAQQIRAVRDRLRRLEDVLDLTIASPPCLPHSSPLAALPTSAALEQARDEERLANNRIAASMQATSACSRGGASMASMQGWEVVAGGPSQLPHQHTSPLNSPLNSRTNTGWEVVSGGPSQLPHQHTCQSQPSLPEETHKRTGSGAMPCKAHSTSTRRPSHNMPPTHNTSMAASNNRSPLSTASEDSIEGELEELWRGMASVGGHPHLVSPPVLSAHHPTIASKQEGSTATGTARHRDNNHAHSTRGKRQEEEEAGSNSCSRICSNSCARICSNSCSPLPLPRPLAEQARHCMEEERGLDADEDGAGGRWHRSIVNSLLQEAERPATAAISMPMPRVIGMSRGVTRRRADGVGESVAPLGPPLPHTLPPTAMPPTLPPAPVPQPGPYNAVGALPSTNAALPSTVGALASTNAASPTANGDFDQGLEQSEGGIELGSEGALELQASEGGIHLGIDKAPDARFSSHQHHKACASQRREGGGEVAGEGQTVWVMGGWNGYELLATTEYLDTRISQWARGPSLPTPRRGACAVALPHRLLLFGGWDGCWHLADALCLHLPHSTAMAGEERERVAWRRQSWEALPPLPHPVCRAAAAALSVCVAAHSKSSTNYSAQGPGGEPGGGCGGRVPDEGVWQVFVVGGHAGAVTPRVHVLTLQQPPPSSAALPPRGSSSQPWHMPPAPNGDKEGATSADRLHIHTRPHRLAAASPHRLHSPFAREREQGRGRGGGGQGGGSGGVSRSEGGGSVGAAAGRPRASGRMSNEIVAKSAAVGGSWREVARLLTPRTHHCCAAIHGLVLAIGGTDGCCVLGSVECYDTSDPSAGWLPLRPLNQPREGAAAVVLGDAVFVLGGHDAHEHLCSVEVWRLSPFRPDSQSSSAAAAAERRAWMMRSEWKAGMCMVQPRSWLGAAAVGDSLVALGGDCGRPGNRLHSVETCFPAAASQHYSTAKMKWKFINGMRCGRSEHAAAAAAMLTHLHATP